VCGGCAVQHWSEPAAAAWKRDLVVRALGRRGIETKVHDTVPAWTSGRRRAGFQALKGADGVTLGFARQRSHQIEPITDCLVLTPALAARLDDLRALAGSLAPIGKPVVLHATATDTGLDVDLRGGPPLAKLDRDRREQLSRLAETFDLARLSLDGQAAIQRRAPIVVMGKARVAAPPGAFLQPTASGEDTLWSLVADGTKGAKSVVDLHAGLGTFSLRLKERAKVRAYEADPAMVAALKAASDGMGGGKALEATARDLVAAPVTLFDLKGVDAVVFDPPRAGAAEQAEQLARWKGERIVGVSCDAATFARDARTLIDGGWRLTSVTPVDQFRFAAHVELVGVFSR
jgi:23S rRNA (uracil1939-C5)-methyltransferase